MTDLADVLAPSRTALLVVDAQNAFASPESPLADRGVDLSGPAEAVPALLDLLAVARDAGLSVAFTRTVREAGIESDPADRFDVVPGVYRDGEPICRAGEWDAAYVEGVEPREGEYEVAKTGYDAFHGTPLDYYLDTAGVESLVVCGFMTDVCVEGTARGAHERGYDQVLVPAACGAPTEQRHETAVSFVDDYLGTTASVDAVRDALDAE